MRSMEPAPLSPPSTSRSAPVTCWMSEVIWLSEAKTASMPCMSMTRRISAPSFRAGAISVPGFKSSR